MNGAVGVAAGVANGSALLLVFVAATVIDARAAIPATTRMIFMDSSFRLSPLVRVRRRA